MLPIPVPAVHVPGLAAVARKVNRNPDSTGIGNVAEVTEVVPVSVHVGLNGIATAEAEATEGVTLSMPWLSLIMAEPVTVPLMIRGTGVVERPLP